MLRPYAKIECRRTIMVVVGSSTVIMNRMENSKTSLPEDFYGKAPQLPEDISVNPEDVGTISAIVTAMYESISGPAGKERQWNRLRSLFVPGAFSIRTGRLPDGTTGFRAMSTEDYIAQAGPWLANRGFYEREIHRIEERFADIAHVFSTYESLHTPDDPQPFMRGINSLQLMFDGHRWWILSACWQHEGPETPIPRKYLPQE